MAQTGVIASCGEIMVTRLSPHMWVGILVTLHCITYDDGVSVSLTYRSSSYTSSSLFTLPPPDYISVNLVNNKEF